MALQAGEQVGPYQVIGPLGQGGMASVFQAYHAKLDRYVAIKMMHKAFLEDEGFKARFEREAQIVAKMEHPHIVPVYDYAEYDGQPFLVMKFIEGQTLKKLLAQGPLPLNRVIEIMSDIADALTYAHKRGVLHRDIKPSNILIDAEGTAFLTDFGLARVARAGASTMSVDMILGTPQYISPEQAAGQAELDPRTDVYSLGVILYEMVVGRVPFNADTPYAVVHDHIYSELPRPSEINPAIPPAVEAVLLKALSKRPADRFDTPNAMMHAFRAAVQQSGLVSLPDDRDVRADESFARRQSAVHDSPTLSDSPPVPPGRSRVVIPPPLPGANRKPEIEINLDPAALRQMGERVKENLEKGAGWVQSVANTIERAAEEGARAASQAVAEERLRTADPVLAQEERIRRRVEKRLKKRQEVIQHIIIYLIINVMLWAFWAASQNASLADLVNLNGDFLREVGGFPWPLWVTFGWGIGLFANIIEYYNKYGPGAAKQEEIVQREIERERQRSLAYEKPKREARLQLTDDGEIEEVYDEEPSAAQKRKRR